MRDEKLLSFLHMCNILHVCITEQNMFGVYLDTGEGFC